MLKNVISHVVVKCDIEGKNVIFQKGFKYTLQLL